MAREISIDLDIALVPTAKAHEEISRLAVVGARGYTRDGGAPTITADCKSHAALRREGARLKAEIDDALARARAHYGEVDAGDKERDEPRRSDTDGGEGPRPALRIDGKLRVRDVMTTDVRTLDPNDALSVADELMSVGRFRHVVVVDEDGGVCGVISRRDIFHGALAWSLGQGATAHRRTLESYPVKQVMESSVLTVDPDAMLGEAAALMISTKVGCLPVVEGDDLVGILTEGDFLALLTRR